MKTGRRDTKASVAPDHGICCTCEDLQSCTLQRHDGQVMFCEQFNPTPDTQKDAGRGDGGLDALKPRIRVRKNEDARPFYLGLCRNCGALSTCTFTKPGGGTWTCEEYKGM